MRSSQRIKEQRIQDNPPSAASSTKKIDVPVAASSKPNLASALTKQVKREAKKPAATKKKTMAKQNENRKPISNRSQRIQDSNVKHTIDEEQKAPVLAAVGASSSTGSYKKKKTPLLNRQDLNSKKKASTKQTAKKMTWTAFTRSGSQPLENKPSLHQKKPPLLKRQDKNLKKKVSAKKPAAKKKATKMKAKGKTTIKKKK